MSYRILYLKLGSSHAVFARRCFIWLGIFESIPPHCTKNVIIRKTHGAGGAPEATSPPQHPEGKKPEVVFDEVISEIPRSFIDNIAENRFKLFIGCPHFFPPTFFSRLFNSLERFASNLAWPCLLVFGLYWGEIVWLVQKPGPTAKNLKKKLKICHLFSPPPLRFRLL